MGHLAEGIPGHEYSLLIQSLIDKGSDPNVMSYPRTPNSWDGADHVGGTAFDLFAKELFVPTWNMERCKVTDPITMTILQSLIAAGGEFSKPMKSESKVHSLYRSERFESEIRVYRFFEEQIERMHLSAPRGLLAMLITASVRSWGSSSDHFAAR